MRPRTLVLAAAAVAVLPAPLWGPPVLREVPWFGVRRVEISGTRMLAPHEVLRASGIHSGQNVWSPVEGWERALLAHPAVAGARVTRRLPHTLRVRIQEKRPVALLVDGGLRPATAAGELLPVDPTRSPVDLPLVHREADSSAVRPMLSAAGRIGQLDPALFAGVSEVRSAGPGALVLVLGRPYAEVTLPFGFEPASIRRLRAVLQDLRPQLPAQDSTAAVRIDLRYDDQIIVRLPSTVRQL